MVKIIKSGPGKWKTIEDNKMRWHGDIDYDKKIIRINRSKKKNKKKGEVEDTMTHEELHRIHPNMSEKNVQNRTKKILKKKK